jgi:integrase
MRLEEISQLYCADISEKNGLWIIDVHQNGKDEEGYGKTLKNSSAFRIIPMHQALIDLGFLTYHKTISEQGYIKLFPDLKKTSKVGKFGKQPGKQFKTVVDAVLSDASKKAFHSLRHTFADFFKQGGLQTDIFRQLYGHEIPELAAKQYGSKFPPDLMYREIIEKLDYGLDLSALNGSAYCQGTLVRKTGAIT